MTARQTRNVRDTLVALDAALAAAREQAQEAARAVQRAEALAARTVRLARGTVVPTDPNRVGDEATTETLYAACERLLKRKPHTLHELVDALGLTNRNRVSGILVRLQRDERGVVNLGDGRKAVWSIPRK